MNEFIPRGEFLTVVKLFEKGQEQLSKQMTEGFSGVNARLDHLSERVAVSEREAANAHTTIAVLQERTKALDDLPKLRERVMRSEWRIGLIIGAVMAAVQFLMWWFK